MIETTPDQKPKRFVFALLPQYSAISFTSALETLRIANRLSGTTLFETVVCSESGESVYDSLGGSFPVDSALEDCHRDDTIVVCTGADVQKIVTPAVLNWLRKCGRSGVAMGGLCTGAYALAKAGLIAPDVPVAIHWENQSSFAEEFPDLQISEYTYTLQGRRYSTAGGTASIDLMLHFVSETQGDALANLVADQLMYTNIRVLQHSAKVQVADRVGFRHPKLSEILALMETNLEEPLRPGDLAQTVNISTRQLERLFRRYLQSTPKKYYTDLRLQRAQHLLLQTNMSVMNVGLACGFNSASHFSRLFRQRYGMSPHKLRGEPDKP
ncbi:GlxA family transcriptional regulator [Cochlodiniinecator piscidefendens]|uniref:GlxA family transcriptional regulator n=1 Tax=Cochlodiniinecator piscidefendens TaxID=2715756 RepID=UPI00140C38D7|nr:GlxA family transcriptional regulator [Cochlodiniinecator piscidefendens]